jgi:hypothetical protein
VTQTLHVLREAIPEHIVAESLAGDGAYHEAEDETRPDELVMTPERCLVYLGTDRAALDLGYLSHAPDAANVLYRVINDRYLQRRPILLTTNKPLASLAEIVHDGDLAEAILDRLVEWGVHFALRGRSYRTRHLTAEYPISRRAKVS